jgi:hypothetical protein
MSKIKISPVAFKRGVDKYGEDRFGALFMADPDHCAHDDLDLHVKKTHEEYKGRSNYEIYEICRNCGNNSYRGFHVWGVSE